jgi:hypothetical protein
MLSEGAESLLLVKWGLRPFQSGSEGGRGWNFDVGLNAGGFPVALGVGVNGAVFGNGHPVVIVDAMPYTSVGTPGSSFADDSGALQHFQVVGELLRSGDGGGGREDKDGLVREFATGNR